jgi:hypothetical protein
MDNQCTNPVVLLVDADEAERFLHRQPLEPPGFEIVETEDGAAALESLCDCSAGYCGARSDDAGDGKVRGSLLIFRSCRRRAKPRDRSIAVTRTLF